jgi:peptide/nickel transport system substrate-binding protein
MRGRQNSSRTGQEGFLAALGMTLLGVVLTVGIAPSAAGTTRPHYGGTLRVEMRARVNSLDPRNFPTGVRSEDAEEKLGALLYDRLVELDENGQPRAALAMEWKHDADFKRWQFRLRPNVKFQDGAPLTANEVARWWQLMNGTERLAVVTGDWLWIQSEQPMPKLLAELTEGRNFVFRIGADGAPVGTGPFRATEFHVGRKLVATANEDYWGGRPFVDGISLEMDVNPAQQMIDLELGRADLVEVTPEQARRAAQSGRKLAASEPVTLLALVFDVNKPAASDPRARRAISLAIDRGAICNVLLQRQGVPAGGVLPQWLSGYAFLFETAVNVDGARDWVNQIKPPPKPLTLGYDAGDVAARTVAERVALNARDAGISIQVVEIARAGADARLVRMRLPTIDGARALSSLANATGTRAMQDSFVTDDPEKLYATERAMVDDGRVIPLAYLPETVGLGAQVRNWLPRRWGEWRLADVWLDVPVSQAARAPGGPKKQ